MNSISNEHEGTMSNNTERIEATNIMYMTHGHISGQYNIEEPTIQEPTIEESAIQEPTIEEPAIEEPTYCNFISPVGIAIGELKDYVETKRDELAAEYKV